MAIVVYAHRLKRPPKKKATAADVPKLHSVSGTNPPPVPAVATPTSEKRLKRQLAERAQQSAAKPSPEVDAFFARNVRPGGPLPPDKR